MKKNATKTQSSANATKKQPSASIAEATVSQGYLPGVSNRLKFTAKCGTVERSLTFPINAEIEDWIWAVYSLYGEPEVEPEDTFELEGSGKMKITLSIVNFKKTF